MGSESVGQTGRSKKEGDGRKEGPKGALRVPSWSRRHPAGGWRSAEDGESGGDTGAATRDSPWLGSRPRPTLGPAGGAGRAAALPPAARVSPGLAGDSSGHPVAARPARAPRPLEAPPGEVETAALLAPRPAVPASASVPTPCWDARSAPGLWPLPPRPQPICPALPQPCSSSAPPSSRSPRP